MSQRESGYQRKLLDQYKTPAWVTLALIPHLPEFIGKIWEPACGGGKMVAALRPRLCLVRLTTSGAG
jgi:hypothetical protein